MNKSEAGTTMRYNLQSILKTSQANMTIHPENQFLCNMQSKWTSIKWINIAIK